MKFAVVAPVAAGVTADPAWMGAFAQHVEACGFESIVVVEHTVLMSEYSSVYPYDVSGRVELAADCPVPDPLDLLAFLAGQTDRLGLATGVLVLPNHHPVVLAKRVATLDALSGGRFRLCVGMGWLKEEIEAYAAGEDADYALGRITCIAHHWTVSDRQASDLVWHLRYDDEYLRKRAGWRIHGRALTINAIETRPVRRLREHPTGGRAAAADPSTASTSPQRRETNRRGRLRDTP
jgi:alkanesulfonate monooxygenase SsuD/methylene tetrahydromethanopterin reductase-like flavin-dependent oxidoreductase (luciferase family)